MSEFITVNGIDIEYFFVGKAKPDTPTLVFLHEGLGSASHWKDFPHEIAEKSGLRVLVYSRHGYGRSAPFDLPRPVDFLEQEGEKMLPALLHALRVDDCILIGHSDGGSIALIFGGSGQTAVSIRGIVSIAAHTFNQEILVENMHQARDAFLHGDMAEKMAKYHDHVERVFWGWYDTWTSDAFRHFNIEHYLPHIKVPILIIQGKEDHFSTLQQVESIAQKSGGVSHVALLDACQHAPHKEQREQTVALITHFVQNL